MDKIRDTLRRGALSLLSVLKWLPAAGLIGAFGGCLGAAFHISIDFVTDLRAEHAWVLFLLPFAGAAIQWAYTACGMLGTGTDRVLESIRDGAEIRPLLIPLIFGSTVLTHLAGGSAGREGAALQLGGTLGHMAGKAFRLRESDRRLCVTAGMSAVFSALFGTPLAAVFFALEITEVGMWYTAGFIPCLTASYTAGAVAQLLGVSATRFSVEMPALTLPGMLRTALLACLCAYLSILLCASLHASEHALGRLIKKPWVRGAAGGCALLALSLLPGMGDYNGGGMDVIARALAGDALPWAFACKLAFTVLTIASGFKGGEVVPSFFIGATFGCAVAPLIGLPAPFAASVGMIAVFCGAVNCPIASVFLALEIFGGGMGYFAAACAVSFALSGNYSLYSKQRVLYSRLTAQKASPDGGGEE